MSVQKTALSGGFSFFWTPHQVRGDSYFCHPGSRPGVHGESSC
jgi:hypothetical protein